MNPSSEVLRRIIVIRAEIELLSSPYAMVCGDDYIKSLLERVENKRPFLDYSYPCKDCGYTRNIHNVICLLDYFGIKNRSTSDELIRFITDEN